MSKKKKRKNNKDPKSGVFNKRSPNTNPPSRKRPQHK